MNLNKLAIQALRYLSSLKQPLPCESDVEFYAQNKSDYEALLTLNEKGLGATEAELFKLALTDSDTVFVMTVSHHESSDNTFNKSVDSIWYSMQDALDEMARIENNYTNRTEEHMKGWRARRPISQPTDLSIDLFDGKFYNCKSFYSINKKVMGAKQ